MDLINVKTEKAREIAINNLKGNTTNKIKELRKKLIDILDNNTSTRAYLLAIQRINKIEKVLNNLPKEDKEAVKKIFFEKHNQVYAEMNDGITKDMYYNIKNKIIYLTAIEFELI